MKTFSNPTIFKLDDMFNKISQYVFVEYNFQHKHRQRTHL